MLAKTSMNPAGSSTSAAEAEDLHQPRPSAADGVLTPCSRRRRSIRHMIASPRRDRVHQRAGPASSGMSKTMRVSIGLAARARPHRPVTDHVRHHPLLVLRQRLAERLARGGLPVGGRPPRCLLVLHGHTPPSAASSPVSVAGPATGGGGDRQDLSRGCVRWSINRAGGFRSGCRSPPGGSERPAEPLAQPSAHHPGEVVAREPGHVVGKDRAALVVGAGHARQVRAPERPPRA